jgi:hypothetical protein
MAWAALHFWIVPRIEDFRPKFENLATQAIGVPVTWASCSLFQRVGCRLSKSMTLA